MCNHFELQASVPVLSPTTSRILCISAMHTHHVSIQLLYEHDTYSLIKLCFDLEGDFLSWQTRSKRRWACLRALLLWGIEIKTDQLQKRRACLPQEATLHEGRQAVDV